MWPGFKDPAHRQRQGRKIAFVQIDQATVPAKSRAKNSAAALTPPEDVSRGNPGPDSAARNRTVRATWGTFYEKTQRPRAAYYLCVFDLTF